MSERPNWTERKSILNIHWKGWCWSWSANTLATWCEDPTHWKRPWCWERLRAEGEGGDRVWDGWMASPTQCTWIWANSGRWWSTGKPVVLQFMGLQRVGHALEQSWFLYMLSIIGQVYYYFFCIWISNSSNPFFRKTLFLYWITFVTCPELFDYICVGPVLDSLFLSSYLSTNTIHIGVYSYMVSLKIKEWKSFNFVFLF